MLEIIRTVATLGGLFSGKKKTAEDNPLGACPVQPQGESDVSKSTTTGKKFPTRIGDTSKVLALHGNQNLSESLPGYITSFTLRQIGYLDSVDFYEKKLPDANYLYFEQPDTKEKIYIDDFDLTAKRLFIIQRFFRDDTAKYLNAVQEKLPQ